MSDEETTSGADPARRARLAALLDDPSGALRFAPLVESMEGESRWGPGDEVERWRLMSVLGRGGMGEVFLAERTGGDFAQRVALKLLRPGSLQLGLHERFVQERRILARLEHPRIARLVDGGVAPDGSPFLALEYVSGLPITDWCRERRATVEERLRVLLEVCDAVQYAHGQLVVHRDLKPANTLVDADGHARLLDFGIAKLLDPGEASPAEGTILRAMTPSYAAPEQIRGAPVSAATDVWALGVMLFELLAGARPFGGGDPHTLEHAVLVEDAPRPSDVAVADASRPEGRQLVRRLRGDLDRIVLRALAKEPERRYGSVEALAGDLRRHLAGLPVAARGDSFGYRAAKFLRRHRLTVAAAVALIATLVAGFAATAWQAARARREAASARREAVRSQAALGFLADLFALSDPAQSKGKVYTDAEMLQIALTRIERDLAGQPDLQAPLYAPAGAILWQRGEHELGVVAARRALAVEERLSRPGLARDRPRPLPARQPNDLAGQRPEGAALPRSVLAALAAGQARSQDTIDALGGLEQVEGVLGNPARGGRAGRPAVELTRELHGAESREHGDACARSAARCSTAVSTARRGPTSRRLPGCSGAPRAGEPRHPDHAGRPRHPRQQRGRRRACARSCARCCRWPPRPGTGSPRLPDRPARLGPARGAGGALRAGEGDDGGGPGDARPRSRRGRQLRLRAQSVRRPRAQLGRGPRGRRGPPRRPRSLPRRRRARAPTLLLHLAGVLIDRGELGEAHQLLLAADRIDAANGGRESLFHVETLHGLGRLALAAGDRTTARSDFEGELGILRRQTPEGSRLTARRWTACCPASKSPIATAAAGSSRARRWRSTPGSSPRPTPSGSRSRVSSPPVPARSGPPTPAPPGAAAR